MGRSQGCTVSWISSQELTPQRSVAHQEPHIRQSTETIASKFLIFNKSESTSVLKKFSWKMGGNVCTGNVSFVGYHGFIGQVWVPVENGK